MKLRYTLPALADLSSVLDYIAAHSPQGASRVQARIQTIIASAAKPGMECSYARSGTI